jgi:hypothetical protein
MCGVLKNPKRGAELTDNFISRIRSMPGWKLRRCWRAIFQYISLLHSKRHVSIFIDRQLQPYWEPWEKRQRKHRSSI